jgi:hypothetical protein
VTGNTTSGFRFVITYKPGETFAPEAGKRFPTEVEAYNAMERIITLAAGESDSEADWKYFKVEASGTKFRLVVRESASQPILGLTTLFTKRDQAAAAFDILRQSLLDGCEGMHVFEHILLRPLPILQRNIPIKSDKDDPDYGYFPLCPTNADGCDCDDVDYYSFRISVVLPYWPSRFRDMAFRQFAEDTIHRETPAHILPRFCWVGLKDMIELEEYYQAWFEENSKYKPNMNTLRGRLTNLIKKLNKLTNVYPVGRLHDCANPSTDNPVLLNQTMLGTF